MKKICIINCYFGKKPPNLDLFLDSCNRNSNINWLLVTDFHFKYLPNNVKHLNFTLKDLKNLINLKLNMSVSLETPYKCCDYKIAYGLIFEDYLKGFDYWGYSDFDVIYGNLSKFLAKGISGNFDKIWPLGHLSILKNNEKMKFAFKLETSNSHSYIDVFNSNVVYGFDEHSGINEKLLAYGFKIFSEFNFVDITLIYKNLKCADKNIMRVIKNFSFSGQAQKNYRNQLFVLDNGEVKRFYIFKNKIMEEDFAYIHYRMKLSNNLSKQDNSFIISQKFGFCDFEDKDKVNKQLIIKYNQNENIIIEKLRLLKFIFTYIKKYRLKTRRN